MYEGWLTLGGTEMINVSRTAQLSAALGIDTLRIPPTSVAWIDTLLSESGYGDITNAPWYDAGVPASSEFAGIVPLRIDGADDSTLTSGNIEYIGDGGINTRPRHTLKPLVFNIALLASTEAGADYGLRWFKHLLRDADARIQSCFGKDLHYISYKQQPDAADPPIKHRRRVRVTRGVSITRRKTTPCSATILLTFTLTAGDPFEYGEPMPWISALGGTVTGPGYDDDGDVLLTEATCPAFDYTPVYDPAFPALLAPPASPAIPPQGWTVEPGDVFRRYWATTEPLEPTGLSLVPIVTLTTDEVARMVRVSIWAYDTDDTTTTESLCDPLWSVVVSYLPNGVSFIIDGEDQTAYTWDGANSRLANSLVYSPNASPIQWRSINGLSNNPSTEGFVITLDLFEVSPGTYEGAGTVRAAVEFVEKSD